ncbi:T9SS type A sorting domain-containing protein [Rhodohalobacter sp. 614A]|uniref:T9SS type A sorting domain-containing protein n=1 Tax=Rhodohalobacter sp. 614A TaxID=2908649 RepID=UPI001F31031E|nr:T9SS type A sorting domain-containing protein [Rhodohalobacter sp. 614A]
MGHNRLSSSHNSSYLVFWIKFLFSAAVSILFLGTITIQNAYAQPQTLEAAVGSVGDASASGPATTVSFDLLRNANNPGGNTFSTYLPQTTVTITIDNFNTAYNSLQANNTNPLSFGWYVNFANSGGSNYVDDTYLVNGIEDSLFTGLNYISDPTDGYYTATDAGNTGEGIDLSANYGAFLVASLSGLQNQPMLSGGVPIDYDLADLTIEFSEPLTNPVIHFMGLGADWDATINNGASIVQNYRNSASVELDLIDAEIDFVDGDASDVTLSVLSESVLLGIEDDDKIINTSDDPSDRFDYDGPSAGGGSDDADGAAHGSVLVTGENITSLTFRVFVRSGTTADEGFGWAGNDANWTFDPDGEGGDPAEAVHYSVTEGTPDVSGGELQLLLASNADGDDPLLQYYFAEDAFMISVSTELEADETLLTVAECYRMLSAPVEGTTYATLLDPIWTQGMPGADYTSGDPNVWLWPDEPGASDGDWEGVPDLGNIIAPGSGFLVSVYSDDDYTNSPADTGFDKTLSVTGSENAPLTFTAMNDDDSGWTLLGNPFKSPLHIATTNDGIFEGTTQDVVETVYIWNRNTESGDGGDNSTGGLPGSWITGTSAGGGDIFNDDGTIAAFQGFFVQNNGSNPQVDFRDASKATDGTFYGKEKSLSNFARFELNGEGLYNSMWLQFSNEGSLEKSITDALELQPMSPEYAMLGTKKADGTIYDIGHYPIPDDAFEIPVSLETTRSGYFTITATDLDLSFGADLYFIDLVKKESIRIDENFSYQFSTEAVAKVPGGDQFNRCSVNSPQKAKTFATADRFMIATQPRDFVEIPATVALNQNYPNPFNPTTQISYDLPQTADVRLEVYDLVGRQVATLVNQTMEAGSHLVNFDASNLSSGVYIYRLNAGNMVLSRKLTVIK